jgi:hypothetical protein
VTTSKEPANKKAWLKLAIIPVLVGVLGIVVWSNQSPKPIEASSTAPPAALVSAPIPLVATPSDKAKPKRVAWPKFTHEEILATNPFRGSRNMLEALKPEVEAPVNATAADEGAPRPHSSLEQVVESDPWAALLEEFPGASKGIFIESSKGPAFKIGSRMLQVGDRIGKSFRVTAIRPDGIVVEAAPAPQ